MTFCLSYQGECRNRPEQPNPLPLSDISKELVNAASWGAACWGRHHRYFSSRGINFKSFTKPRTTFPTVSGTRVQFITPLLLSLFLHQPSTATPILLQFHLSHPPFLSLRLTAFPSSSPILMCRLTCGRADQAPAICHPVVTWRGCWKRGWLPGCAVRCMGFTTPPQSSCRLADSRWDGGMGDRGEGRGGRGGLFFIYSLFF